MRLAFTAEYDGTSFSGFQKQKNAVSIQQKNRISFRGNNSKKNFN
jgi:tRNA U38,U39,U40 pseudouridine synthase TruA